jgi:hypothetical protein
MPGCIFSQRLHLAMLGSHCPIVASNMHCFTKWPGLPHRKHITNLQKHTPKCDFPYLMHRGALMLSWLAEACPSLGILESSSKDGLFGGRDAEAPNGNRYFQCICWWGLGLRGMALRDHIEVSLQCESEEISHKQTCFWLNISHVLCNAHPNFFIFNFLISIVSF